MLNLDMMGEMTESQTVSKDSAKVEQLYRAKRAAGKSSALMMSAFGAFTCDLTFQFIGGISSALLNFMSPFIVLKLVKFIEEGVQGEELSWESVKPGVILSSALVGSQLLSQFILQHIQYH